MKFKGKSIADILDMTINQAVEFFENQPNILNKIKTIQDVGLGYIKLGQSSTTLSGGESQRVKLSSELSKRDTGRTVYILDEPTTGLDVPDERRYLENLRKMMEGLPNLAVLVTTHALFFLDDCLPSDAVQPDKPRQPLFDRVILVHKEPESGKGQCGRTVPSCHVTSAVDSTCLCEAVMERTPDKSVEDSMESFVEWQAGLVEDEFSERVENEYFLEDTK